MARSVNWSSLLMGMEREEMIWRSMKLTTLRSVRKARKIQREEEDEAGGFITSSEARRLADILLTPDGDCESYGATRPDEPRVIRELRMRL